MAFIAVFLSAALSVISQTTYTFGFTGAVQSFTIPPCVNAVSLTAHGARGGSNAGGVLGGLGGAAGGQLAVSPGDVLHIFVGGTNGYNGGGLPGSSPCVPATGGCGGGATDVRLNGIGIGDRILVAGGGGGSAGNRLATCGRGTGGGGGGGYFGGGGGAAWPGHNLPVTWLSGGGSQNAGGTGGMSNWINLSPSNFGTSGSVAIGGNGGNEISAPQAGSNIGATGGAGGGLTGMPGMHSGTTSTVTVQEQPALSGTNYTGMSGGGGSSFIALLTGGWTTVGTNTADGYATLTLITGTVPINIGLSAPAVCLGNTVVLHAGPPGNYTWSTGANTNSIVVQPTVTSIYTVTALSSGCTGIGSVTMQVDNVPPILALSSPSITVCPGSPAILTASGAQSYTWSGGVSNGVPFAATSAGIYTVTGTNGCGTASATAQLSLMPSPVLSVAGATTICIGNSATLTASGAGNFSWSHGLTNGVAFTPSATALYTVTGTSAQGCTAQAVSGVTVTPFAGPAVTITPVSSTICSGTSLTLNASGTPLISWSTGASSASVAVSPSATSLISVTGTNTLGCISTAQSTVVVDDLPVVTLSATQPSICAGQTVALIASGATTYSISNGLPGSHSFTPLSTAAYSVTGTNACGTATAATNVTVHPLPVVGIVASTNTLCTGSPLLLNGTGAVSYTWNNGVSNGVATYPNFSAVYHVTGANIFGCVSHNSIAITVHDTPAAQPVASSTILCAGESATLSVPGTASYTWLPSGINSSSLQVTPVTAIVYTLMQATTHCASTKTIFINVAPVPVVTPSATNYTFCAGDQLQLAASGAGSFIWQPGAHTGSLITVSPASNTVYTVTINNGVCASSATVQTINLPKPVITFSTVPIVCAGQTVAIHALGATGYTWTPAVSGSSSAIVIAQPGASFAISGESAQGCITHTTISLNVAQSPPLQVGASHGLICSGGSAQLFASGANSYSWNTGSNSPTINVQPVIPTVYSVTGSGASNCTSTATLLVNVFSPTLSVTGNSAICVGQTASLIASGATSYTWNGNHLLPYFSASPTITTVYQLSAAAFSNGVSCPLMSNHTVSVFPLPMVKTAVSHSAVCKNEVVTLTASGALSYQWNFGPTGAMAQVTATGNTTYFVTGTDANGCISTASVQVRLQACTGFNEFTTLQVMIFPNPATSDLHVKGPEGTRVTIFDVSGKWLNSKILDGNELNVDLTQYCAGLYLVVLEAGNERKAERLMIAR